MIQRIVLMVKPISRNGFIWLNNHSSNLYNRLGSKYIVNCIPLCPNSTYFDWMITFHFWKAVSHRPPTLEPGYLVITDVWEFIRPLPVIEQRVTCHLLNRLVIHLANSPKRWYSMVLGNSSRGYWKTPLLKWSPSFVIFWTFVSSVKNMSWQKKIERLLYAHNK